MIRLTLIEHGGTPHEVSASAGSSLMQAAVDNAVPGIDADCGGGCACGTCHIKVPAEWRERVGAPNDIESMILDQTHERDDHSRLACQITLEPQLDGLVVHIPEFQM